MGRGDSRTRRGKIFKGSYGNARKQGTKTVAKPKVAPTSTTAKKTPAAKKTK